MGVKSHSSSIDDPSADRVRRLADSEGLRREPIVDEPEPAPTPKRTAAKGKAEPVVEERRPDAVTDEPAPAPAPVEVPAALVEPAAAPHRVVRSTGVIPDAGAPAPRPAAAPAAPPPPPAPAPAERPAAAPAPSPAPAPAPAERPAAAATEAPVAAAPADAAAA